MEIEGRWLHMLRFACCLTSALLLSCTSVAAQEQKTPERGLTPGGSYAVSDIETISTTNGNLMLNIPLARLPLGRGGMTYGVGLVYNSKLWETHTI